MRFSRRKLTAVIVAVLSLVNVCVSVETPVRNVALNKPVTAVLTCGTPAEAFYGHRQINLPAENRVISTCDASNATLSFPPAYMVDQDVSSDLDTGYTWWQSASLNRIRNANSAQLDIANGLDTVITVDLTDFHYVESVSIQMGDSVRPTQMAIQKSMDGATWINWSYKVSSISQCQSRFQIQPSTAVANVNGVLCTTYTRAQLPRNEVISFDLIQSAQFRQWQQTRYVRFQFFNMPQEFGLFANQFHHYTVRNLAVMAPCQCNDHASQCELMASQADPTKMMYQCVCGGNTGGTTCNECLPFYNQYPYQQGTNGFQCGECNCFQHSDKCNYDINVGNLNASINANGLKFGGGVCADCKNNTAGINCNECKMFHYRPADKNQTEEDACQSCSCHLPGTREDTNIGLVKGECIPNNDVVLLPGTMPGDCYCKPNVEGQMCDVCKDGYYDLTDANPSGCLSCNCYLSGTVNGSNTCNKTSSGQCPCKENTFERRCDQCKDGFFGLLASNPAGCNACGCDVGGAMTPACHKVDGQCTCRPNVQGRACDSVAAMSYYGTLHTIGSEFEYTGHPNFGNNAVTYPNFRGEGYVTLAGSTSTSTNIIIPTSQLSGVFQIVMRVADDGPTQVSVTITPTGGTLGTAQQGSASLGLCSTWCSQVFTFGNGDTVTLGPGEWSVVASVNTQGGARVLFDYVTAIPVEFADPSGLLGPTRATQFIGACDVITNNMKLNTTQESICLPAVFSLTTYYFNGAKQCSCDLTGSFDNNCDTYSGQCRCKPGVGGRRCDVCLPEYYNFRSTGCTACECAGANKICNPTTGQCECPPNTAGRRCDRCLTFAWGLNEVTGCQPCNCHQDGSISQQCDLVSGACDCHPGVGSQTCSECLDGFTMLSAAGCQPCGCSPDGSLNTTCNKTNGQCECKANVGGRQCNDCAQGTFYNSETQSDGCLQCICMGITNNCASSTDRSIKYTIATTTASVNTWQLVTVTPLGDTPYVATPTANIINGHRFISVPVPVGAALYWVLPQVNGKLLGVYGTVLTFSLFYELDVNAVGPADLEIRVYMQGLGSRLVRILGTNPTNTSTEFTVKMIESEWRVNNPQFSAVTRGQFLRALVNVDSILISAQMNSAAHTSSIGSVSYYKATGPLSPSYNPAAQLALTVENCNCGPGYVGSSCEECDVGYHRSGAENHPYFGTCVPCQCNGHSTQCNQTTGECLNCQHNTQGFNCEQCGVGFYGNATVGTPSDCTQCPCGPPRSVDTTCSLVNGVVTCSQCSPGHLDALCNRCDVFHFGQPQLPNGFCTPCNCNGNSESCNPITGVCLNCRAGTTGDKCERCNEQTYGDASEQNCQACNCDAIGSSGNLCDHVTGQCPCKPGVGQRVCSGCQPNFYAFNTAGCTDCACNEFGSIQRQCNGAGVCPCLAGVMGGKCDQCEPGSFGLPLKACAVCACNALGTVGSVGATCESVTGQCPCQPGVGGRQCDMCQLGYVDLTVNGCTKCDKCVETLLNSTYTLNNMWIELWADASLVGQLQERDAELQRLEPQANRTIQQLTATIDSYSKLRAEIQQINQQQYYTDVNNLLNRVLREVLILLQTWIISDVLPPVPQRPVNCPLGNSYYECVVIEVTVHNTGTVGMGASALNRTIELLEVSSNQITRISALQVEAQKLYNDAVIANQTILTVIDVTMQWVNTANNLYASADPRIQAILVKEFTAQQALIEAELSRSQNVSSQAEALHASITNQALELNRLVALVNAAEQDLTNIQQQIANLKQDLDEIDITHGQIDTLVNETQTLLAYSNTLVAEALLGLQTVGTVLGKAQSDIFDGNRAFSDAGTIRVGAQNGVTVPELVPNPYGINGWIHGEATARNTINTIEANLGTTAARVGEAETRAAQHETTARNIVTIFGGVQANGQTAVQAIQMYQDTLTVYAEAVSTSQQATTTLAQTQAYFAQRPVTTIQQEAATSRQASIDLRTQVNARTTNEQALDASLTAANQTLMQAETLWTGLAADSDALASQGVALNNLAQNPGIQPAIDQGTADSNTAIAMSATIISGSDQLDARLQTDQLEINMIKETVANASTLNTVLPTTVANTETQLTALQNEVASLQEVQTETARLRSNITSKMEALREKLRLAQEKIANTKQPVRFKGQSSVSINRQGQDSTLFNELRLDFKADQRDGLLFFAENPNTNAFISLEIVTSHLMFKFNVRADIVAIDSPIEVCCDGEWYRALATRNEAEGQLSVVKLSTGGASVNYNSSINTYDNQLVFASGATPLFVGGLPAAYRLNLTTDLDTMTTKALSTDYEGCIANVMFDNQELDLWRPNSLEGSTSCCEGPTLPEGSRPNIVPGIGFTGFGYLEVQKETFNVFNQAAVSFKFRTFLQDAVLFLVSRLDLISYIGVYVNNGKLVYQMTTSGNAKYDITSLRDYNDANWYKVMLSFNESHYDMDIFNVSNSDAMLESFSRQTLAPLRFSNLQYSPKVILGAHISALPLPPGQTPTQFIHGPNGLPFAGAMNDLMLSNGSSWNLVPRLVNNVTAVQYKGVTFNGVLAEVAPGVGFKGAYAFAKLRVPNLLRLTKTITFSFKTLEPHGILAYSYDGQSFNKLFYVALYHGNIFLQYNIGEGQSEPLQTRGLRLNTGQWQSVSIDFSGLSASLKVNDLPTIYGNRVIPTRGIPIIASNSFLYVGGVPETTPNLIGGDYPVRQSINSGILNFAMNGDLINFNDPAIVVDQLGMDLSGIPPEVTSLPPLPYPTQPPPDTTPSPMMCAAPIPVLYHPNRVVRLGTQPGGYMAFDLTQVQRSNFANGFVINMEFRTVAPEGVLFYSADNAVSPRQFLVLTMFEGKLSFSIMTSTRAVTGLNINTKFRYDDGQWHEVVVLRINDFVAILVQERRDYDNNGVASNSVNSTLAIGTSFYVGGIVEGIRTMGLAVTNGFDGCIRKLEVSFTDVAGINFNFDAPNAKRGVAQCIQNEVGPGASFNGTGSWIQLQNNFQVTTNLEIKMVLRTSEQRAALLFAVSANSQNFFAADIHDGNVRVAMSHHQGSSYIARSTQLTSIYDICNGRQHEIIVRFKSTQLELIVDGKMDNTPFSDAPTVNTNSPLYIGGVPNANSVSIGGLSTDSFTGCIVSLAINGVAQDLGSNVNSAEIITGCPLPRP